MSTTRDERRKAQRDEERKRQEEIDRELEKPRLPSFDAPATGRIVNPPPAAPPKPAAPKPPKKP